MNGPLLRKTPNDISVGTSQGDSKGQLLGQLVAFVGGGALDPEN